MDVESVEPTGEFIPSVTFERPELTEDITTRSNKFSRVKLIETGVHIGWLGTDSGGWCIISDQPTLIQPYVWSDGKTYYRDQRGHWLSIQEKEQHRVGFYSRWASAIPWWLEGNRFFSNYITYYGKRPELSKWRNQANKRLYLTVEDPKFLITLDVKFEEV